VALAYGTVRERLVGPTLADEDAAALHSLTEAYERAAFGPTAVPREMAEAAIEDAETLLEERPEAGAPRRRNTCEVPREVYPW